MKNNFCLFCEQYDAAVNDSNYKDGGFQIELSAKMLLEIMRDDRKVGQLLYSKKPLYFCPVCGRQLKTTEGK